MIDSNLIDLKEMQLSEILIVKQRVSVIRKIYKRN